MFETDVRGEFQDAACAQADGLLLSYDQRLRLPLVSAFVMQTHELCKRKISFYDPEIEPLDYEAIFNPISYLSSINQ